MAGQLVGPLLLLGQEIKQERGQARGPENLGDQPVPGAVPSAAGPVGEEDHTPGLFVHGQVTHEGDVAGRDPDLTLHTGHLSGPDARGPEPGPGEIGPRVPSPSRDRRPGTGVGPGSEWCTCEGRAAGPPPLPNRAAWPPGPPVEPSPRREGPRSVHTRSGPRRRIPCPDACPSGPRSSAARPEPPAPRQE